MKIDYNGREEKYIKRRLFKLLALIREVKSTKKINGDATALIIDIEETINMNHTYCSDLILFNERWRLFRRKRPGRPRGPII